MKRQVDAIEEHDHDPIAEAEAIRDAYQDAPPIVHEGVEAYYQPLSDTIKIPELSRFHNPEGYYSTLFHEMAHSTGHATRLDRDTLRQIATYGDHAYSKEELVAEIASAFLCAQAGIGTTTITNQTAYCKHWIKKLKDDPKMIVWAAQHAQKAADHITGSSVQKSDAVSTKQARSLVAA